MLIFTHSKRLLSLDQGWLELLGAQGFKNNIDITRNKGDKLVALNLILTLSLLTFVRFVFFALCLNSLNKA